MPDTWRKIERGLFESADGQWRISNPWKLSAAYDITAYVIAGWSRSAAPTDRDGACTTATTPRSTMRAPTSSV